MDNADLSAYWATMAQILVVVALAIVVEARALMASWDEDLPDYARRIQVALWSGSLACIAFLLPKIVSATRTHSTTAAWLAPAADMVLSLSSGIVVGAPALDFFARAFASPIAGVITLKPIEKIEMWKLRRQIQARLKSRNNVLQLHERKLRDLAVDRAVVRKRRARAEERLDQSGLSEDRAAALQRYIGQCDQWLEAVAEGEEKLAEQFNEMPRIDNLLQDHESLARHSREAREAERNALTQKLREGPKVKK